MKRGFVKASVAAIVVGVVVAGITFVGCGEKANPVTPPAPVYKEIPLGNFIAAPAGWVAPFGDKVQSIGSDSMQVWVNGGDISYVGDSTLVNGAKKSTLDTGARVIIVKTPATDNTQATVFILDYRSANYATNEFLKLKSRISANQKASIGSFGEAVSIGYKIENAKLISYSHFGKYLFEITISSTEDFPDQNKDYATGFLVHQNTFINFYKSMLE